MRSTLLSGDYFAAPKARNMKARGKRESASPLVHESKFHPALKGRNNRVYFGPSGLHDVY